MSDPQNDAILIVEPDPDLLAVFSTYFQAAEAFQFYTVATGQEALMAVLKYRPRLILIETQLPDRSGLSVLRELQSYPRTAHIPTIFLAGGTEILLQNRILEAGAYDFIEKPVDVAELGLRIRNALRRTHREGILHPLTRLPIGSIVEDTLNKMSHQGHHDFLRVSLVGFEAFKELYGFVAADEVMTFVGNVLSDILAEHGEPGDFIGHQAETEFVIVTQTNRAYPLAEHIHTRLDSQLPQFYGFQDRDQGYVEISDETGHMTQQPLMHIHSDISQGR